MSKERNKELRSYVIKKDFSNHNLIIEVCGERTDFILKQPNTNYESVIFSNSNGVCTVSGDYGNYVFCREFHPSSDGFVSRGYFDEKIRISSDQQIYKLDSVETIKLIDEFKNEILEEQEFKKDYEKEEFIEWIDELKELADSNDEVGFEYHLYRTCPVDIDMEYLPYAKVRRVQLDVVYDSFNWMCQIMDDEGIQVLR